MNRTKPSADGDGLLRIYRPSIIISPAMQKVAILKDIRFGLQCHRDLDSLPFGFVGHRGKKFMVVTTADFSKTIMTLSGESENLTKNLALRELKESTVNE